MKLDDRTRNFQVHDPAAEPSDTAERDLERMETTKRRGDSFAPRDPIVKAGLRLHRHVGSDIGRDASLLLELLNPLRNIKWWNRGQERRCLGEIFRPRHHQKPVSSLPIIHSPRTRRRSADDSRAHAVCATERLWTRSDGPGSSPNARPRTCGGLHPAA